MIERNMRPWQNITYLWWPIECKLSGDNPHAYLRLWGEHYLTYNFPVDWDEQLIFNFGPFKLVSPLKES